MTEVRTRPWGLPASVYLLVTLVWSWPLPLHLASRFTHDPGDPLLVTYLIWWNAHAIPLTAKWWNAPFFWPMKNALALTEHLAGLSPFTTPVQWLGGSPLLAYNLLLLASTWWSGLATHALVRRLTGRETPGYIAGLAFAFAPYRTSTLAHLQLYACWWIPLIFLGLHGYDEDGRRRWLAVAAGSWLMQGLTNGYFLLFLPILVGVWLAWFTTRATWRRILPAAAAFVVAGICLLPFLLHYRTIQYEQGLSRTTDEAASYSAYPGAFLATDPIMRVWHLPEPRTTEQYLFPGLGALLLTVAGVGLARRSRRFWFYAAGALLMTALAAGPAVPGHPASVLWHPYALLAGLPGFTGLRVPSRFFMLAVFCLAVAAGIAFAEIQVRTRHWRWIAAVAILVLACDGAIAGMPLGVPPGRLVLPERDAHVLVLPYLDLQATVYGMYQSMSHHLPVVNGYAGYIPSIADVVQWALARQDETLLTELRRGHPLYVIVAPGPEADQWSGFIKAQPGAEMTGVQSAGEVFRLPATPFAEPERPLAALDAAWSVQESWLVATLPAPASVAGLEVWSHGNIIWLPRSFTVQTSMDGAAWTTVFDERPGGLALLGALRWPRVIPIRAVFHEVTARFVRVNETAFGTSEAHVLTAASAPR